MNFLFLPEMQTNIKQVAEILKCFKRSQVYSSELSVNHYFKKTKQKKTADYENYTLRPSFNVNNRFGSLKQQHARIDHFLRVTGHQHRTNLIVPLFVYPLFSCR